VTNEERDVIKSAFEGVERSGVEVSRFFKQGGGQDVFDVRERVLFKFLEEITSEPKVTDTLWEEVRGHFSEREIVEILSLQVGGLVLLPLIRIKLSSREGYILS